MRRREFILALGGAAAWPLIARAQQGEPVRRVGVLMGWSRNDPGPQANFAAFIQALAQSGWFEGRNIRIEQRWTDGEVDRIAPFAKQLIDWQPDVILASTTPVTAALRQATNVIPIVFVVVSDPVGAGIVESLRRPGGNLTGFVNIEAAMGGKWMQMVKEIAPQNRRAAIMFNPDTAPGGGNYFLEPFEATARALAVEPITVRVHSDAEIETAITALGREQGSLVVMTDSFMSVHQRTVISAAAANKVPAIFDVAGAVKQGGLMSYGPNSPDMFRRAGAQVGRILRGAKPSELPVEVPTKFELVINLKTAKALGLDVPLHLQQLADEVIE